MIVEIWRAATYPPVGPAISGRYVRQSRDNAEQFEWIETSVRGKNGWKWDVRRGTAAWADLPDDVTAAAAERLKHGVWPFYVDWPL